MDKTKPEELLKAIQELKDHFEEQADRLDKCAESLVTSKLYVTGQSIGLREAATMLNLMFLVDGEALFDNPATSG